MSPHSEKHDGVVPSRFLITIGGFTGSNYEVRLVRGRLRYQSERGGPSKMVSPTEEDWQQFWAAVQRCDLWNWEARYDNPGILDGTQWKVVITLGSRRLQSFGSNAYPGGDEGGGSKPFQRLLQAVRKLVGGNPCG